MISIQGQGTGLFLVLAGFSGVLYALHNLHCCHVSNVPGDILDRIVARYIGREPVNTGIGWVRALCVWGLVLMTGILVFTLNYPR